MKKIFVVALVLSLSLFGASMAFANQSNTGCGLGTLVFPDADTLLFELLVTTTNGTSGNQTFGMTTGTLNCEAPASYVKNEKLQEFVAGNMDSIAQDIAAGHGESLDTLAELMQVQDKDAFASTLQSNFSSIFTSASVQSSEVIDNIAAVL